MSGATFSPDGALLWLLVLGAVVLAMLGWRLERYARAEPTEKDLRLSRVDEELDLEEQIARRRRRQERIAADQLRVARNVQGTTIHPPVGGRW